MKNYSGEKMNFQKRPYLRNVLIINGLLVETTRRVVSDNVICR